MDDSPLYVYCLHALQMRYRRFDHLPIIFPKNFKSKSHLQYSIFLQFLRSNGVTHQNTYFDRRNFWFSMLLLSITWFDSKSIWFLFETHNHISLNLTPDLTFLDQIKFVLKFSVPNFMWKLCFLDHEHD